MGEYARSRGGQLLGGDKARNLSHSPKPPCEPAARVGKDSKLIIVQLWLLIDSQTSILLIVIPNVMTSTTP